MLGIIDFSCLLHVWRARRGVQKGSFTVTSCVSISKWIHLVHKTLPQISSHACPLKALPSVWYFPTLVSSWLVTVLLEPWSYGSTGDYGERLPLLVFWALLTQYCLLWAAILVKRHLWQRKSLAHHFIQASWNRAYSCIGERSCQWHRVREQGALNHSSLHVWGRYSCRRAWEWVS